MEEFKQELIKNFKVKEVTEFVNKCCILATNTWLIMIEDRGQVVSAGFVLLLTIFCFLCSLIRG